MYSPSIFKINDDLWIILDSIIECFASELYVTKGLRRAGEFILALALMRPFHGYYMQERPWLPSTSVLLHFNVRLPYLQSLASLLLSLYIAYTSLAAAAALGSVKSFNGRSTDDNSDNSMSKPV